MVGSGTGGPGSGTLCLATIHAGKIKLSWRSWTYTALRVAPLLFPGEALAPACSCNLLPPPRAVQRLLSFPSWKMVRMTTFSLTLILLWQNS